MEIFVTNVTNLVINVTEAATATVPHAELATKPRL